ncbi:hypothetical protein [Parasedimentitalea huanghaiensis]|uniref:Uncharacterized protein n=1 Tax=Parasedimentitalea huanghaiensis TaxID=2682100 RepID=A0A6L6WPI1_9RHOB|nr:hypothetical protein [Zongyanglinia huanghaiensis]MVO18595.1 hypothetical protein [Zongyanglinia huanghaiensis]
MPEILVPTDGHAFVNAERAQWFALETLFVSRSRRLDFEDLYLGGLSKCFQEWVLERAGQADAPITASHLKFLAKTERLRALIDAPENNIWPVIERDILPLSMVIDGVINGASQSEAFAAVSSAFTAPGGFRGAFEHDPEFKDNFPLPLRRTSVDRLEQVWRKYRDIFQYVVIWRAGCDFSRSGGVRGKVPDAHNVFQEISSIFKAASRTKRIKLPEPTILKFVTSDEYEQHKKDS